jgi:alcohol dehydrogenase (cytochrome c)
VDRLSAAPNHFLLPESMNTHQFPTPTSTRPASFRRLGQLALGLLLLAGAAQAQEPTKVPFERIRDAGRDAGNWLSYGGNYSSHRHSTLTEITPANVANLKPLWVYQQADTSKWEVTPIVVDGIMFISERPNIVTALDARTGRPLWNYRRPFPDDVRICCGTPNRGLAVLNDAVYLCTFDAHLVCLDANTGLERWDVVVDDYRKGYSMTAAPLAVKDKIVVGVAGAEFGIRSFVDAFDAKTGERAWRFWTVPGKGEPGNETWGSGDSWKSGGGSTWVTGSYDPELNLIYWGTGNPAPDYNGDDRPGDNLYTCAEIALDADTGKLKWHFQFTPHDVHDWDSCQTPVLFDAVINGKPRKMLSHTNRNGMYYALDRTTGQFVAGGPFSHLTWAKGLDDTGRPILIPNLEPTPEGVLVYPGLGGAVNWPPPSYSPVTGLIYVNAQEDYGQHYFKQPRPYKEGEHFENGGGRNVLGSEPYGVLKAINAATGKIAWEYKMPTWGYSPVLSTVTGLVFTGTGQGDFYAVDANNGKLLWKFPGGSRINGGAVSYLVDGKQRIAVPIGAGLFVFGLN